MENDRDDLTLVLSGVGAFAACWTGFIRCITQKCSELRIHLLAGASSDAIHTVFLANHPETFSKTVAESTENCLNATI